MFCSFNFSFRLKGFSGSSYLFNLFLYPASLLNTSRPPLSITCRLVSSSLQSLAPSSSPLLSLTTPQINKPISTTLVNKWDLQSSPLPLVVLQLQPSLVDPLLPSWPNDLRHLLSPLSEPHFNAATTTRISLRDVKLLLLSLQECSIVVKQSRPLSRRLVSVVRMNNQTGMICMRFRGKGDRGERKSMTKKRMLAGLRGEILVSLPFLFCLESLSTFTDSVVYSPPSKGLLVEICWRHSSFPS